MLIFKKEKTVRKLALQHTTVTHNCLKATRHCFATYLSHDSGAFKTDASEVHRLESEADTLKRQAQEVLQSGAYLPHIRSDVSTQAAMGELCKHILTYTRGQQGFQEVLNLVADMVSSVQCHQLQFAKEPSVSEVLGITC